jgi:hypothetical protein
MLYLRIVYYNLQMLSRVYLLKEATEIDVIFQIRTAESMKICLPKRRQTSSRQHGGTPQRTIISLQMSMYNETFSHLLTLTQLVEIHY